MSHSLATQRYTETRNRPTLFLRSSVWLRRRTLDNMLAQGADPSDAPQLARRAAQLTSSRHRRSLAVGIERALREAERPRRALSPAVPLQRHAILRARVPLARLAAELRGDDPESLSGARPALSTGDPATGSIEDMTDELFAARGVALVQRLLTDGDSPLYTPYPSGELELAVRHANAALLMR